MGGCEKGGSPPESRPHSFVELASVQMLINDIRVYFPFCFIGFIQSWQFSVTGLRTVQQIFVNY